MNKEEKDAIDILQNVIADVVVGDYCTKICPENEECKEECWITNAFDRIVKLVEKQQKKIEYKDNKLNWKSGDFDTSYLVDDYITFEILEEEPEEINIQDIGELEDLEEHSTLSNRFKEVVENRNKVNQIIKYLKQLDKKENK